MCLRKTIALGTGTMAANKELRVTGKCQQAQEKYRIMIHRLSTRLGDAKCNSIRFIADLPIPELCESTSEGFSLHVLSSLEANGHISPWNVDYLEFLLTEIHREDLLRFVRGYKESKEHKNAMKERKKAKRGKEPEGNGEARGEQAVDGSGKTLGPKRRIRNLYTLLINHITGLTQVMEMLRSEMGEEGVDSAVDRFLQVERDGEQFTADLRKVFRDMGINSNRSSISDIGIRSKHSSMSSDGTPAPNTHREDPTDCSPEPQQQPPPTTSSTPKTSRKKPVPLPRMKNTKAAVQAHDVYTNLRPIEQEEGRDVSLSQYRRYLQSVSAMPLSSREPQVDGEEGEEDTADTGDSGIAEWISGCRAHSQDNLLGSTPPDKDGCTRTSDLIRAHSESDLLDPASLGTNKGPVYTSLLKRDGPVSEYASVRYGDDMQRW